MIIGIGGKMGSGKNLVCDIIQYFTSQDVSPDCIKRIKEGLPIKGYHNSKFEQKAFAEKLKTIASLLTGIPVEDFEDQEFKKTLLGSEWGTVRPNPLNAVPVFADVSFNELMSVRELLQRLGTEAMRDGLHTNVWVNALMADYIHTKNCGCEKNCRCAHDLPNWIITDMRFPNEMEAIVEKGGITIRVVRNNNSKYSDEKVKSILKDMGYVDLSDGVWEELAINEGFTWFETFKLWTWDEDDNNSEVLHPSETSLDDSEFDYEIQNDGSIEDLIEKVKQILITEKII